MSVAVIAVLLALILAIGLLVVVAVSAGHLEVKEPRLERAIDEANRHLSGTGEVPRFLERLDERAG